MLVSKPHPLTLPPSSKIEKTPAKGKCDEDIMLSLMVNGDENVFLLKIFYVDTRAF
jgi:hypothetical protein